MLDIWMFGVLFLLFRSGQHYSPSRRLTYFGHKFIRIPNGHLDLKIKEVSSILWVLLIKNLLILLHAMLYYDSAYLLACLIFYIFQETSTGCVNP